MTALQNLLVGHPKSPSQGAGIGPTRIPVYPVQGRDSDGLLSQPRLVQLTRCLTSKWVPESCSTWLGASVPTAPCLPGPLQSGAQSNSFLCAWPLSCLPGQGAQGGKSDGWAGKAAGTRWGAQGLVFLGRTAPHNTPDGAWTVWRLKVQDPGVAGLFPPDLSPGLVDTDFSLCPHMVALLCVSVF